MKIQDVTETNLINLRRTIYLTIMSAAGFEEAGHKLTKIDLKPGQEIEVVSMLIECCSQEKTFLKYGPASVSFAFASSQRDLPFFLTAAESCVMIV